MFGAAPLPCTSLPCSTTTTVPEGVIEPEQEPHQTAKPDLDPKTSSKQRTLKYPAPRTER